MKWRNWVNAILGVWFIISPWVVGFSGHSAATWTTVIIGAVQVIVAVWAANLEDPSGWKVGQTWISLVTGVWFIVAPFVLNLGHTTEEVWTSIVIGLVTVALSLWTMGGQSEMIKV